MATRVRRINSITPAQAMRRSRSTLYAAGYHQHKLRIPKSFIDQLDTLKRAHKLTGRDAVAGRILRKAKANRSPESFTLPPAPDPADQIVPITLVLHEELGTYLYQVAASLRNATLGVAFEAIFLAVPNISPEPIQLSLIQEEEAVSG